jgi:hypothetical protein
MYVRKELNFRGYPNRNQIIYYDGEEKSLEIDHFEKFWSLLKLLSTRDNQDIVESWAKENDMRESDLTEVLDFLMENHLVSADPHEYVGSRYERNYNFFHTFQTTELDVVERFNDIKVTILGLGTVGSTLVDTLMKLGINEFTLIDYDTVERKNVAAQTVFNLSDTGRLKTEVVKEYIHTFNSSIHVKEINRMINDIRDIKSAGIDGHHYIFKCFDEVNEKLMKDLLTFADLNQSKFVSLGYFNDSVKAYVLSGETGKNLIEESYADMYTDYVISNNRGTILHSMMSSVLGCHIILEDVFGKESEKNVYYSINPLDMMLIKQDIEENDEVVQTKAFLENLGMFDLTSSGMERELSNIKNAAAIYEDDLPSVLENKVMSLYQVFDMLLNLGLLDTLGLRNHYREFMNLLDALDDDEEGGKYNYSEYLEYITNLKVTVGEESRDLISTLIDLNNEHNDEKRKQLQTLCFKTLRENSKFLLNCLNKNKMDQLKIASEHNYYEDIMGIRQESFTKISTHFQRDYSSLFKGLLENISSIYSNSNKIDYLYQNHFDNKSYLSLDETIELLIDSLERFLPDSREIVTFIRNFYSNHCIGVVNENSRHNINKTYYLPYTGESRIILNYDGTFDSIYVLCHELGHAYYNTFYNKSHYVDSKKIVNETLANTFEILCFSAIVSNEELEDSFLEKWAYFYNFRLNKMVFSDYASFTFEEKIIEAMGNNKVIDLDLFMGIGEELEISGLYGSLEFENRENSSLNILLDASFIFGLYDHSVDPIAYIIATKLASSYKEDWLATDINVKECLSKGITGIDDFMKVVTGERLDEKVLLHSISDMIKDLAT